MAALDYARLQEKLPGARLLFVAHREEILEQSMATFRHALRDRSFGELWVGGKRPKELAARRINVVFSVDLFNEGVDVPSVDTLLMLRPTDSSALFLFSPTTRYRDYAISRDLIHWESQSATRAESETGRRYPQHVERGTSVMLFARLRSDERAFYFLGAASYVKHESELPMAVTWRLSRSLPGDPLHRARGGGCVGGRRSGAEARGLTRWVASGPPPSVAISESSLSEVSNEDATLPHRAHQPRRASVSGGAFCSSSCEGPCLRYGPSALLGTSLGHRAHSPLARPATCGAPARHCAQWQRYCSLWFDARWGGHRGARRGEESG